MTQLYSELVAKLKKEAGAARTAYQLVGLGYPGTAGVTSPDGCASESFAPSATAAVFSGLA